MQYPAGASSLTAIARLRDELAGLTDQLAGTGRASAQPMTGEDPTGTVRLILDHAGRPAEVEVASTWRTAIGPDGLADAVRQAWQAAVGRRLTAWSDALGEPRPAGEPRRPDPRRTESGPAGSGPATAPAPAATPPKDILPPGSAPGDLLGHQVQSNLSGVLSLLADAEAALDRIERTGGGPPAPAEGRDPAGRVTVVVSADSLVELRADRRWLAEVSGGALGAAIRQALADAYAQLDRAGVARRPPVVDELTRLTADPLALLRTVGLLRD